MPLSRGPWCEPVNSDPCPPAAHRFLRQPSLPVKLGGPVMWGCWAGNWAFQCQVSAHVVTGKAASWGLASSAAGRPCDILDPQSGGPPAIPPWVPSTGLPLLLCLVLVTLNWPRVSSSPSGSHVLQRDLIMLWWCHLANAIRKFPQDFSCFAGRPAWLPGRLRCSWAHGFSPG